MNAYKRTQVGRIAIHPAQIPTIVERFFAHEAAFYLSDENYKLAGEHAQWQLFHVEPLIMSNPFRRGLPSEHSITITAKHIPNECDLTKPNTGDYPDKTIGKVFVTPVQDDSFVEIEKWIFDEPYLDALWAEMLARLRKVTDKENAMQQNANGGDTHKANRTSKHQGRKPMYDFETMCEAVMGWRELQRNPR